MNWHFLVPLLGLTFPVYKTLIWVLRRERDHGKSEIDKQLDFVNYLLSDCGFVAQPVLLHPTYIKQNLNNFLAVHVNTNSDYVQPGLPHHYQDIEVTRYSTLNDNKVVYFYQIDWRYQTDRGAWFMYWDATETPPSHYLEKYDAGDYSKSRSAFMSQFQSLLDSL